MGSPIFVKRGVAVRKGKLARTIVVVRSIIEPIWARPSLRTIFINKNIVGYCRYIGLVSFVVDGPVKATRARRFAVPPQMRGLRAKRALALRQPLNNASNDIPMTRRRIMAPI
ncbi:MAG TPA: hypothetical protein VF573_04710 [Paraburkholderia sp.]|uniref:hypothetical protein n=1 Tax=Paraburkholderia sp. TaxID=1926495 RepID=UPI002ED297A6